MHERQGTGSLASGAAGSCDFDRFTEAGDSQLAGQSILWRAAGFLPWPLAMPIPLQRQYEQQSSELCKFLLLLDLAQGLFKLCLPRNPLLGICLTQNWHKHVYGWAAVTGFLTGSHRALSCVTAAATRKVAQGGTSITHKSSIFLTHLQASGSCPQRSSCLAKRIRNLILAALQNLFA